MKSTLTALASLLFAGTMALSGAQGRDFRAAIVHPTDYPASLAMKNMGEKISAATKGRFGVKVYGSSTLGSAKDAIEQVKIGAIEMTWISGSDVNQMLPETVIPNLPFLFRDIEHFRKVMYGPIGDELRSAFDKFGFVALSAYEAGSRSFYAKKPIRSPADLKGMKVRVTPADIWLSMMTALGASPMPLPYAELYTGLKTGLVDAAENNYPSYETAKHYEAAPVFSETQHVMVPEYLIFSKKVWDTFSKEDQAIIRKAAQESVQYYVDLWMKKTDDAKKTLVGHGVKFIERNEIDHAAFAASQKEVWEKYANTPELKALLTRIIETK